MEQKSKQPTSKTCEYSHVDLRSPWHPSPIRRLPWLGLSALLGTVLGIMASIAILMASNGQPTDVWSLQPKVLLAIASTITNILLHLALSEGARIAWWRCAMKDNTTIADLHRYWSFANSLWAAITSGRHFNLMASACILVALSPVNGPLLQRASRISVKQFPHSPVVGITIAQSLPWGYTGFLSSRENTPALLTNAFAQTLSAFNSQTAINMSSTGCIGECATQVKGAGFAVNCSTSTTPFSLTESLDQIGNSVTVFNSTISWDAEMPGTIELGAQVKDTVACIGDIRIQKCTLQASVVGYPVIVNGNQSTIELAPGSTIFNDTVYNATDIGVYDVQGPTTLGGLSKALMDTYNSQASMGFAGAIGYQISTSGATCNRYVVLSSNESFSDCSITFKDPMNDILEAVRDLMFRTAIAAANNSANSSDTQQVMAQETLTIPVYESQYLFLGLAIMCSAAGCLAIFLIILRWWSIGRTVSMSPVETAKAFGPPQLRNSDSNANINVLLKEVGDRPIRYGVVASGAEYHLEMKKPEVVRVPHSGERFSG